MLNCCSGCSAWQKGRASSSESTTRDTHQLLKHWALPCPVPLRKCIIHLQHGVCLLALHGFSERVVESLTLLTFWPRLALLLFPSTFSTSPLLPGPVCAFQTSFLSAPALCFPRQTHKTLRKPHRKGRESLEQAGGLSRHQHKVPFVSPCAFISL